MKPHPSGEELFEPRSSPFGTPLTPSDSERPPANGNFDSDAPNATSDAPGSPALDDSWTRRRTRVPASRSRRKALREPADALERARASLSWLVATLTRPGADRAIVVVGTLLVLPSLVTGLVADDYIHAIILKGLNFPGFAKSPFALFRFALPGENGPLIERGILPWWTDPELRFAFFRPLSAATHWVDYALFPASPMLMHLHSVAWAVLGLLAVRALYRSIMGPGFGATLALALYALDDARGPSIGWVANRNALIGLALSMGAVVLFHRGARGSSGARWLGPVAFAASLAAGEAAIAGAAYLVAYAIFLDGRPASRRVISLVPFGAVAALWLATTRFFGYGVSRSGEYLDPLREPLAFLRTLPGRGGALLLAQLGGVPSEWANGYRLVSPILPAVMFLCALAVVVLVGWVLWPHAAQSRRVCFWITGALLSVIPASTAFPSDRMLLWVSVGAMGALAEFVRAIAKGRERRPRVALFGPPIIVFLHLVVAPLLLPGRAMGVVLSRAIVGFADRAVPRSPDVATRTVVYVNPPSDPTVSFLIPTRVANGVPIPATQLSLATATGQVTVSRLDAHTLSVTLDNGYLLAQTERMFRSDGHPLHRGDVITLPNVRIEVTRVLADGRPESATFRFSRPLDDPSLYFLAWKNDRFDRFTPPAVGASVTLAPSSVIHGAAHIKDIVTR